MKQLKKALVPLLFLFVGIVLGGYLFSQSQPRSFLSLNQCQNCLSTTEFTGLLASVGIQKLVGLMPFVVFETDKTVVIKNPLPNKDLFPDTYVDYVIIPKKDIKNIGELAQEDSAYLNDAYLVARYIIEKEKLTNYRMYTNGPGLQDVAYLHFHLINK